MTTTPPSDAAPARMIALAFDRLPLEDTLARGRAFYQDMNRPRTTRHFSRDPVPREAMEWAARQPSMRRGYRAG